MVNEAHARFPDQTLQIQGRYVEVKERGIAYRVVKGGWNGQRRREGSSTTRMKGWEMKRERTGSEGKYMFSPTINFSCTVFPSSTLINKCIQLHHLQLNNRLLRKYLLSFSARWVQQTMKISILHSCQVSR